VVDSLSSLALGIRRHCTPWRDIASSHGAGSEHPLGLRAVARGLLLLGITLGASQCRQGGDSGGLAAAGRGGASSGSTGIFIEGGGTAGSGGAAASAGSTATQGGRGGTDAADSGDAGEPNDACTTLVGLDQCGATRIEAQAVPVNVLFVIDKSGSMTDQPQGFGSDKWSAMKQALEAALASVPPTVNSGLLVYPASVFHTIPLDCEGDLCCEVPEASEAVKVGVGPGSDEAIVQALSDTSPGGGTPTAAALAQALAYFTQGEGAELEGDRYVLLATDGGPNCDAALTCEKDACTPNLDGAPQCEGGNCCEGAGEFCLDDAAVTAQIGALRAAGIATFVVGIPGSEKYEQYLDVFARAGGVPRVGADHDYFAVSAASGVSGLTSVFKNITTELLRSCEVSLPEPPAQLRLVNVAIDCAVLPQQGNESGWEFDDAAAPTSIIIHGPVCDDLKAEGARRIDVVYGCTTIR